VRRCAPCCPFLLSLLPFPWIVTISGAAVSQTDGGYLGADFETFFSAVVSGAPGVYVGLLVEDAAISTDLEIRPGQSVTVSGDRSLPSAPAWGTGGFTVEERGSLSLAYVGLGDFRRGPGSDLHRESQVITMRSGGSLSMASMAVPSAALAVAQSQLSGVGSTLRLAGITLPESPSAGELTGTVTVLQDDSKQVDPPNAFGGVFTILMDDPGRGITGGCMYVGCTSSGCTVSDDGKCVGRREGYLPNEECHITIGGGGGMLAGCDVFDLGNEDVIEFPSLNTKMSSNPNNLQPLERVDRFRQSNCPVGVALAPGDEIFWSSDRADQGAAIDHYDNHCTEKSLCGLPWSDPGLGGGWQICFA
jgi:hypothetical protein